MYKYLQYLQRATCCNGGSNSDNSNQMPLAVEDGVGARRGVAKRIEHKNKQKKKRNKQTNKQTNKLTEQRGKAETQSKQQTYSSMKWKKKIMFPTELEINAMLRFSFNNSITIMKIMNCFDVFVFVC